ncbi:MULTISPECIES: hypothetical protein [unclassified Crossiella]|uniref:hypothetical protein n=1 Tax=unclassified Crossiella TaxID=2620835 RepID=UPI001FFE5B3F|nr:MULTISPECIES: hypothetical protein [unclassified Crossiella]MCK2238523.1 hypothetical protein [Crossiella sp. S99.2]MCK2251907.1 hypothetical protein [Crossiella sp. S99.1]
MSWFRPGRAKIAEPARRTLLYLMAGPSAGVAVRQAVGGDTGAIAGTVDLPGLSTAAVTEAVHALTAATAPGPDLDPAVRMALLSHALAETGRRIWAPVLAEWPDLRTDRVELAPVGDLLYLPLHTALIEDAPACTVLDLAVRVPLHAPATVPVPVGHPAPERNAVQGNPRDLRDPVVERRTCHGILDSDEPWRSSVLLGHRPLSPDRSPSADRSAPDRSAPLVVVSGGRLSSFDSVQFDTLPVVGALWPLPDPDGTAELLGHLHRALIGVPGACSLAEVVSAGHRHGLSIAVWGPFVHFGA